MKLKGSIVLKQTFILIIMSIFFASSIMMIWLTFLTNHFKNIDTVEAAQNKATTLSELISDYENRLISPEALDLILKNTPHFINAAIIIDLNRETSWAREYIPSGQFWNTIPSDYLYKEISPYRSDINVGRPVIFSSKITKNSDNATLMYVGIPIKKDSLDDNSDEFIGSVYVIKNISEDYLSLTPMILAFIASLCLTIGMMIFPAIYVINLIVNPLFEIKDIATEIASGNFYKFAKTNYKAEFQVLASSINKMSKSLQISFNELQTESHRLNQILNSLNEAIISFSPTLTVTHINPIFKNYFQEDSAINLNDEYKKLSNKLFKEHLEKVNYNGKVSFFMIRKGEKIYSANLLPLKSTENSNNYGVVCVFKDITQEERLEQTRKDYVANVSHELKTPITALRCMIEPIMDGIVHDENDLKKYYNIIYNEALRLSRLIDDMLELSRIQSGTLKLKFEFFDINDLLEDIELKFKSVMKEKNINFKISMIKNKNCCVYADMDRIEQIIYILLDNAMKFTAAGGCIEIYEHLNNDKLYLSIKDSGIGISENDIEHIFDRFYKADKSHSTKGTGLGLSIASEIMQMMGENIVVKSKLNHGSTFTISLSLASSITDSEFDFKD